MLRYRRSPRLPHFDYTGNYAYFLTMVTRQRRPFFSDPAVVSRTAAALEKAALKHFFDVYAYCFMPDHLHLLVSGRPDGSTKEFVRYFKQISSFEHNKTRHGIELWQISYYDRVLRSDEDMDSVACYIWGNPVSAGIVTDPRDYAFSGPRPLPEVWGGGLKGLHPRRSARDSGQT
jgi:putative transposase